MGACADWFRAVKTGALGRGLEALEHYRRTPSKAWATLLQTDDVDAGCNVRREALEIGDIRGQDFDHSRAGADPLGCQRHGGVDDRRSRNQPTELGDSVGTGAVKDVVRCDGSWQSHSGSVIPTNLTKTGVAFRAEWAPAPTGSAP